MRNGLFIFILFLFIFILTCVRYYNPFMGSDFNDENNGNGTDSSSVYSISSSSSSLSSSLSSDSSVSSSSSSSSSSLSSSSSSSLSSSSESSYSSMSFSSTETIGFAFISGYDVSTTTGGEGASSSSVFHITSANITDLTNNANNSNVKIFYIHDSITLSSTIEVGSNTTIIGYETNAVITSHGFSINSGNGTIPPESNPSEKTNIIIRNIHFTDMAASTSAISIVGGSHHIWIDHCTFTNPYASIHMIEINKTSDFVTVSWCVFSKTNSSSGSYYMISIGDKPSSSSSSSSSSQFMEENRLHVTLHHNYFKDLTYVTGSHPRVRYGTVHVLNNYYQGYSGNGTDGIASNYYAKVYAEGNYMNYIDWPSDLGHNGEVAGELVEVNNEILNYGSGFIVSGTAFTPSTYYSYTADSAGNVPTLILNYAGAGKL